MKIARGIFASLLFIVLLVLIYYIHISYFKVNVVFYAAIADGIIAAVAAGIILFALDYFRILGSFEKLQLIMIWLLVGYSLAISVPTVIDRSLSFYILEKLQQRGGGIKQTSFEVVFTQEYVKEYHLVDVRLTEQLESGTIEIVNGCVILTEKGKKFASVSRYFRKHWLPNERLLMGKYSDDLTDPFRNSIASPNYTCK
jgi:hypothetical protein